MRLDDGTWWPDLDAALFAAADRARYAPDQLDSVDAMRLAKVVDAYSHLAAHPAGTEAAIKTLRSLRRAVRSTPKKQLALMLAEFTPMCPLCGEPLRKVRYPGGMLNREQWESLRLGDWFCDSHGEESRYFFDKDLR